MNSINWNHEMEKDGYTLIEILVVLSILSILGSISFHFTQDFIAHHKHHVELRKIVNALQYARMLAIHHGQTVIFCGSSDLRHCDGDWRQGQIIKINEQVLHSLPMHRSGEYWEWRSSLGKNHQIEFTQLGFTHGQQGSFYYHIKGNERLFRIVVSLSGEIRIEK